MLNKLEIIGNLGGDPELKHVGSESIPVCTMRVAVNERFGQKEKTVWVRVTAWRGLAETCAQYLRKGRRVYVEGSADTSAYIDKEGNPQASLELTARTVIFLDRAETVHQEESQVAF